MSAHGRWIGVLLAVGACTGEEDVAYLHQTARVQAVLDDETPSRTWTIAVETNDLALRDGPTWATLNLTGIFVVETVDDWNDVRIDAAVTGDDEATVTQVFTAPGQESFGLMARYQAECVAGEPCTWTYPVVVTRSAGAGIGVAVDFDARALVTLGPESLAPDDAALSVVASEP